MRLPIIALTCLIAGTAVAKDAVPMEVSAFDVFTDQHTYSNKFLHVSGCYLFNANGDTINCGVVAKNGAQLGNLMISTKGMTLVDKRDVLSNCAGKEPSEICDNVSVIGRLVMWQGVIPLLIHAKVEIKVAAPAQ